MTRAGRPRAVLFDLGGTLLASELARHGLLRSFGFVLSSADVGARKPHPAIFREALGRLGARAEETWFVGDSFANDVAGAYGVGVTPIWLAPGGEAERSAPPHHRVSSWPELLELYRSSRA
jgi:putative hydrolase of the HAD superfamily